MVHNGQRDRWMDGKSGWVPHLKNEQIKRKQPCSLCFVNVFKFQENKFKIVQKNFYEIKIILIKRDFSEKPLVTMIIT